MPSTLDHIVISVSNYEAALRVYQAICGGEPAVHVADDGTARFARFYLGDSVIELAEPLNNPQSGVGRPLQDRLTRNGPGVHLVCIAAPDLPAIVRTLEADGARLIRTDGHVYVHPKYANGVLVQITPRREFGPRPPAGDARLDHIAIVVADLEAASERWSKIAGVAAQPMGIHPISKGAFKASRLLLGAQMVELLSPVAGVESPLAARLASHGEGIIAVALPAGDLGTAIARLSFAGARVLDQPPHRMVHPKDTAGVLIQITPRVSHH